MYLGDIPVAMVQNGVVYSIHTDHLGAPQIMTDSAGTVVWQADYLPFGETTINEDPDGNGAKVSLNLRFPGQYFDAETGLHYNWNRYYDPTSGRYLSADPIGLGGGMNLYAYVGGNPVNGVDFMGLDGSPGIGDQINPFGIRGDGSRDYSGWFNNRFPNFFSYAANEFHKRIKKRICANKGASSYSGLDCGADDIDYRNKDYDKNPERYADPRQDFWERRVSLGDFQLKTEKINVKWDSNECQRCYTFSTTMYVLENTGWNLLGATFRERSVRMGEWGLSGGGCCD